MINTGNTQLDALIEELQNQNQLLGERAAIASGKLAQANADITALKAKIADLEKPTSP